ncbi:MAG: ABC transporter permease [Ilumatobacteraceae bacterium]
MIITLARRSLRARAGRSIFTGLAIVAGVAFVAGSFVLADSLQRTFDELIDGLTGEIDLQVRSTLTVDEFDAERDPLPVDIVDQVAAVPDVAVAEGSYARFAQMIAPDGALVTTQGAPTLGVSWDPESGLSGVVLKEGRGPRGLDEVAIDKATADRVGFSVGDPITVVLNDGQAEFTIVGLIGLGSSDGFVGATTVAWEPSAAATWLDDGTTVDTVDLKIAGGADLESVRRAVEEVLPDRTEVVTGQQLADETKDQVGEIVSIFGTGLLVFALVTALVAAFVINNIYNISISQRLRELALLRAIGAGGSQVRRVVLLEAVFVSMIATLIGMVGGLGVARGLITAFNAAGGGFPSTPLVFEIRTAVVAAVVGVGVSAVSVLLPALRASRIPPVAAMRPEVGFGALSLSRRLVRGFVLAGGGLGLFMFGLFVRPGTGAQWGALTGAGAILVIFGVTSLSSASARPVSLAIGAPVARVLGTAGRFARDNSARVPRRTARTASALMIGVTLITGAAVFTSSLRDTFGRILERSTSFDYIVLDSESFQPLTPEIATRLADLPELAAVSPFRNIRGTITASDVDATFTAVDPRAITSLANLEVTDGSFDGLTATDGVMVFRGEATDAGLSRGDQVDIVWQNGNTSTLAVAGIFDDDSLGAEWFISIDLLETVSTQTPRDQFVVASRADGVEPADARAAITTALADFPQATIQSSNEFVEEQKAQIDTLLLLVTMLLTMAIAFSFFGIAITLALSVFERTREIGLLRAVGMGRRMLRRSVRGEAVIVTLFGVSVGIALGLVFGLAFSYAVPNNVIDGITIPFATLAFVVVFAVVAAVAAATYPAFKASRMNVLAAIATE